MLRAGNEKFFGFVVVLEIGGRMENGVLFYINAYFGVFRQQVGGTNQEAFGGGLAI